MQQIGYRFNPCKFEAGGFTPQPSAKVRALRIAECPIQFEAQVTAVHEPAGEWPERFPTSYQIIETQAVCVHADRDIVIPNSHHIDTGKWNPLLYVFRHYFGTGADLGRTFKAEH